MQDSQKNLYKKLLGKIGEDKAVKFLKRKGYKIEKRNFKTKLGEADVIAFDGETVVFVEVKTRSSNVFGSPAEAVTFEKQRKYFLIASEYLQKFGLLDKACRFDVIEVYKGQINHILNAFCM